MTGIDARHLQANLSALNYPLTVDGDAGPLTYAALFNYMAGWPMGDRADILGRTAAVHFPAYQINTPLRIAHWFAQFTHESAGFRKFEESLSYSAERLCAVWPKRFPNVEAAKPFASNPRALAEKVYGGRMGNVHSGDGFMFRGRGPQLTGRANYAACSARTGLDILEYPDLAADPGNFVHLACDFWGAHCLNPLADNDDIVGITLAVNGGRTGLDQRRAYLQRAMRVLT